MSQLVLFSFLQGRKGVQEPEPIPAEIQVRGINPGLVGKQTGDFTSSLDLRRIETQADMGLGEHLYSTHTDLTHTDLVGR